MHSIHSFFRAKVFLFGVSTFILFVVIGTTAVFFFSSHKVVADTTTMSSSTTDMGTLEIHIATNGLILLRDAEVTAMNGTTLTVSTTWGSTNFRWIVQTSTTSYGARTFGTRFLNRHGAILSPQTIQVGDSVTISGMLNTTAQEPTVDADTIRSLK